MPKKKTSTDRPLEEETGAVMWWAVLPGLWVRHAEKLRRSAELLWQPLDQCLTVAEGPPPYNPSDLALWHHVYAFLLVAGTSLEVMLKAAAMQAEINEHRLGSLVTPKKELPKWVLTHNQVSLANRARISLSDTEQAQLDRFAKYVEWAGSYPTHKDLRDRGGGILTAISVDYQVSPSDRIWFDRLYERAAQSYRQHEREEAKG